MRHLVIHASSGDSRTPLMPCCVDFKSARHWNSRADASNRSNRGSLVRMDPQKTGLDNIIDISSYNDDNNNNNSNNNNINDNDNNKNYSTTTRTTTIKANNNGCVSRNTAIL